MKSKSLKSLTKKARNNLQWPSLEKSHEMPVIRVVSNINTKKHTILMPDKLHNRSTDLDYLHELGHATFCEKVHPIFAANIQYAPQENKRQFQIIIPALNSACDWFIGNWHLEISPEATHKQLKETLPVVEELLGSPRLPPLDIILDAAMIVAQNILYLDEPIDCGGILKAAVDAFLSVPPDKPSLESCVLLINRLLATYADQRVRFIEAGDSSAWEIYLPEDAKESDTTPVLQECEES